MNAIGGYLELELIDNGSAYHDSAMALNTGRNALEYILINNSYKKIYVPYYSCDVLLQPLERLKIDFEFYYLNENILPKLESLGKNEVILYINYFGLFNKQVSVVSKIYKNVIIDNSQAFFSMPLDNIPTFYSPRKFFGIPDGGFAYVESVQKTKLEQDTSIDRISHLIERIENGAEAGYESFISDNTKLNDISMRTMSTLTQKLLRNINFKKIKKIRNKNFDIIHEALGSINELTPIINGEIISGPMAYPFLRKGNVELREHLICEKIFVATYWPNVESWLRGKDVFEIYIKNNLVALPIDQRYDDIDMHKIIDIIKNFNYKLK